MPIGISFYIFHSLSYCIDVYRGGIRPTASWRDYLLYVAFFPQLVAGPIVRATSFLPQLASPTWNTAPSALKPFVMLLVQGMVKKVLLGDVVGTWLVDPAFDDPGSTPAAWILVALYGYSLQVYADFSGYTDMASLRDGDTVARIGDSRFAICLMPVRQLDLVPFNGYLAAAMGYQVERGTLDVDADIRKHFAIHLDKRDMTDRA